MWYHNISSTITVPKIFLNKICQCYHNVIDNKFLHSLPYISISIFQLKIHTYRINQYVIRFFRYLFGLFFTCFHIPVWIIFCFLFYAYIFHVIIIWEGVWTHCRLINVESNNIQEGKKSKHFTAQIWNETKIRLREVFWNIIA